MTYTKINKLMPRIQSSPTMLATEVVLTTVAASFSTVYYSIFFNKSMFTPFNDDIPTLWMPCSNTVIHIGYKFFSAFSVFSNIVLIFVWWRRRGKYVCDNNAKQFFLKICYRKTTDIQTKHFVDSM